MQLKHTWSLSLMTVGLVAGFQATSAQASTINFLPPSGSIILDEEPVFEGTFEVTEATSYFYEEGEIVSIVIEDLPIAIDATFGDPTVFTLFDLPDTTQALNIVGSFDPTNPDVATANFNISINGLEGSPSDFDFFLPTSTSTVGFQITEVNDLGFDDNVDTFFDTEPVPVDIDGVVSLVAPGGAVELPPTLFGSHGTSPVPVPEPASVVALVSFGAFTIASARKKKLKHRN